MSVDTVRAAWLVVALVLTSPALVSCGGEDAPADVSLATLAVQEGIYEGKVVRTQGVVRMFEPPLHYWIEDSFPHRVALEPDELVAPLVGKEVRVVGRFHFHEDKGRVIQIEDIAPVTPGSPR